MLPPFLRIALNVALTTTIVLIAANAQAQDQSGSKSSEAAKGGDKSLAAVDNQEAAGTPEKETESKGKTHFHLGAITFGAGYTHFSDNSFVRPFWPYAYAYGFGYSPFFYDSFYYPYAYSSFYGPYLSPFAPYPSSISYEAGKGQVKLEGAPKTAVVRLDGAYAGTAEKLKSMWLEPGVYDLTVSAPANGDHLTERVFHERIYVLSGKTVKIKATLAAQNAERKALDKKPDNEGDKR